MRRVVQRKSRLTDRRHTPLFHTEGGVMHQAIFKHRRAFTAIDLLACAAAVVFAGVLALQVCCASKERANRVKCASNLRQIGQGLAIY